MILNAYLAVLTVLLPLACSAFTVSPTKFADKSFALFASVDESSIPDRRTFLVSAGLSTLALASSLGASAADTPKVLVLGGSGLVGSEVVKKLKSMGVEVVATSRNGRDGTVALDVTQPSINVAETIQDLSKGCSAVISTIGAIGTPEDAAVNGATGLAAIGAKAAGVSNFVYISVAPEVKEFAKDIEFLQSYMEGKAFSEDTITNQFTGDGYSYTIIEPTFIHGGDKFAVNPPRVASTYGKLVEAVLSSGPFRAATEVAPEGFIKIALEPPVSAESVASAAIAGALGKASTVLDTYDKIQEAAKTV